MLSHRVHASIQCQDVEQVAVSACDGIVVHVQKRTCLALGPVAATFARRLAGKLSVPVDCLGWSLLGTATGG